MSKLYFTKSNKKIQRVSHKINFHKQKLVDRFRGLKGAAKTESKLPKMTVMLSNNSTTTSEVLAEYDQSSAAVEQLTFNSLVPLISANLTISAMSLLSQIVVILIAFGLGGDSSAKTLMWVQALAEILKRILSILLQLQEPFGKYSLSFLRKIIRGYFNSTPSPLSFYDIQLTIMCC